MYTKKLIFAHNHHHHQECLHYYIIKNDRYKTKLGRFNRYHIKLKCVERNEKLFVCHVDGTFVIH